MIDVVLIAVVSILHRSIQACGTVFYCKVKTCAVT